MPYLFISIVAFLNLTASTIESDVLQGRKYVNQVGSTMVLNIKPDGAVSGFYKTAVGCGVGVDRPLVGWLKGRAITFTVDFQECESLTSWVGHIQSGEDIITLWTLAKTGDEGWDAKLTGTSYFKLVK